MSSTLAPMNPLPYQVFISHAGEDKHTMAIPLYKTLKNRAIRAFVDQTELPPGEEAPANMETYMETAPIGVFLLGPEFLAKKWPMKELLCYIRRVEVAKRKGETPPFLIPVFYRMTVEDCADKGIFHRKDDKWDGVFETLGFFRRVMEQQTSERQVLEAVQKLSKYTGVVNMENATNAQGAEASRSTLIERVADEVGKVVEKLLDQKQQEIRSQKPAGFSSRPLDNSLHPTYSTVPRQTSYIILDFTSKDQDGNYVTVEGRFKDKLRSTIPVDEGTTDAAVAMTSPEMPGLTGMGGVGKSVVLIALGWETDVRKYFKDGIYFISFGEGVNETIVMEELARVVALRGGEGDAKRMREAGDVRIAVDIALKWLKGKKVLFLLDDVWHSKCSVGLFEELKRLASTAGRVAFTTRRNSIAEAHGCPVYFNPRVIQGSESRNMLIGYARLGGKNLDELEDDVATILEHCAGLPLALGIAGRSIALRTGHGAVDWKTAVKWYAENLDENSEQLVTEGLHLHETSVRHVVETGLKLADDWEESKTAERIAGRKLSELYMRLSVLRKQARVSLKMLSKLWGLPAILVGKIVRKLSDLNLLSYGEDVVGVHDLLLDVCVNASTGIISSYHNHLLREYNCAKVEWYGNKLAGPRLLRSASESEVWNPFIHVAEGIRRLLGLNTIRSWWDEHLHADGYLSGNLARHLVAGENTVELRRLLCDPRWTAHRVESGNILAWKGDFHELHRKKVTSDAKTQVNFGTEIIRDAVTISWPFLTQNLDELGFQMFGRMRGLKIDVPCVAEYLNAVELLVGKPWLMPVSQCLPSPQGPLKMQMHMDEPVTAVALVPRKKEAILGVGNSIIIVDMEKQKILMEMVGHRENVTCVAITPDGTRIVSGSNDGTLLIWEVATGRQVGGALERHTDWVRCVAVTPDGTRIVSGSYDGTLRIWEVATGRQVGEALEGHTESVTCVAVTPDGTRIVSGSYDGTLRIWEVATGRQVGEALEGHTDPVTYVAVTPDGTRIVSGSYDGTLRIWEVATGRQVGEALEGHTDWVTCIVITPDGTRIVSGSNDGTLRIWEVATGRQVGEALERHTDPVTCVAVTPDGTRIVSGSDDGTLRIWEVATGRQVGEALEGHTDPVTCVAVTPDGTRIVSVSYDGTLRIWEVATGRQVGEALERHTDPVTCVAVTPDGTRIVSGSYDGTLRIWEVATGRQVGEALEGHTDPVTCVAVTPDGTRIVSGSYDGTLRIWEVATGRQVGEALEGHTVPVTCVAVTPDGTQIVSGSDDGTLRIWEVATGRQVGEALEGHTDWVRCVAITPDGTRIVSGSNDGTLRIWEVATGRQVGEALEEHTDPVTYVAVTPDGTRIVSGSNDGTLRIWEVVTRRQVGVKHSVHEASINNVQFLKGNIVTTHSYDRSVRWRTDKRLGLVVLSQLRWNGEGTIQEQIESGTGTEDGEETSQEQTDSGTDTYDGEATSQEQTDSGTDTYDVTYRGGQIWMQYPQKQLLATVSRDVRVEAFNKKHMLLVTGHESGAVSIYRLIG